MWESLRKRRRAKLARCPFPGMSQKFGAMTVKRTVRKEEQRGSRVPGGNTGTDGQGAHQGPLALLRRVVPTAS